MPDVHPSNPAGAEPAAGSATPAERPQDATHELVARLNELLEAERAGARVARETALQVQDAGMRELIEAVQRDEVKWCGMLMRAIRRLEGEESARTGAFHGKAMAIADTAERLAFLNRGQGWVVRKLRELLPSVKDESLRRDLEEMLRAHTENIERLDARLDTRG